MVDNLFLVESPLQALVAAELSLKFDGQTNVIIYQLSESVSRQRNNDQLRRVIELGNWCFLEQFISKGSKGLSGHLEFKRAISELKHRYKGYTKNLFFGEFRSLWMHMARLAIAPEKYVLMDDGAATITAKNRFIDKGVFYPKELWESKNVVKRLVAGGLYLGLFERKQACRPISFASTFLEEDSEYKVDFSWVRKKKENQSKSKIFVKPKAYFFGSKYSEAGIIEREYELKYISDVIKYYRAKSLTVVYCAHRDESDEKLDLIRSLGGVEVVLPEIPAELFVLEREMEIAEIGAAYSSVINNLRMIFSDKPITSFRFSKEAIHPVNREAIDKIYNYYERKGVLVKG